MTFSFLQSGEDSQFDSFKHYMPSFYDVFIAIITHFVHCVLTITDPPVSCIVFHETLLTRAVINR